MVTVCPKAIHWPLIESEVSFNSAIKPFSQCGPPSVQSHSVDGSKGCKSLVHMALRVSVSMLGTIAYY